MRVAIAVLVTLGLTTVLLFVVLNSGHKVKIDLFFAEPVGEYPVSLVVLVSMVIGVLFASVIGIVEGARLRLQNHQLRGRIKRLEGDLQTLRIQTPAAAGQAALDEDSVL
jgi:uncharacterized integral membrane protein